MYLSLSVLQNLNPPYKHHPCIHLVLLGLAVHPLSARWAYQCTWLKWLFLSVNLAVTKSTGKSPPQFVTNCEHDESLVEAQGKQSRLLWVRDGQGWVLPRKQQFTTVIPICLLLSAPPLHGLSLSHRSLSVVRVARSLGLHWCSLKQVFLIKSANNICPWVQIQIFRKQFDAVSVSLNNGNQFSRGSNGFSLHVVLSRLTISDTDSSCWTNFKSNQEWTATPRASVQLWRKWALLARQVRAAVRMFTARQDHCSFSPPEAHTAPCSKMKTIQFKSVLISV